MEENSAEKTETKEPVVAESAPAPVSAPTGVETAPVSSGDIPAEVKGWNWGAFFLNWIWGIFNKVWIALVALVAVFIPIVGPIIAIVMSIVLGLKGSEWAWKSRKFESVEQFKKVQKSWAIWGFIIFVLSIIISITMGAAIINGLNGARNDALNTTQDSEVIIDGGSIEEESATE